MVLVRQSTPSVGELDGLARPAAFLAVLARLQGLTTLSASNLRVGEVGGILVAGGFVYLLLVASTIWNLILEKEKTMRFASTSCPTLYK